MISQITIELVNGVKKKVQRIKYSNGQRVVRTFANTTDVVPESVVFRNKPFSPIVRALMRNNKT